ncbi:Uu.00g015680.m01.CDS01 [Anthostomella pinea]|uniref:Uu.00g015680.m01.CDS01 n=1 Tax=Anthostomella pinea TaxID=933095 RepID=A0AAI8VYJ8_9PEZI|nr:Uu.00g015680.m01.CDS01 [Anthostomella pinea]
MPNVISQNITNRKPPAPKPLTGSESPSEDHSYHDGVQARPLITITTTIVRTTELHRAGTPTPTPPSSPTETSKPDTTRFTITLAAVTPASPSTKTTAAVIHPTRTNARQTTTTTAPTTPLTTPLTTHFSDPLTTHRRLTRALTRDTLGSLISTSRAIFDDLGVVGNATDGWLDHAGEWIAEQIGASVLGDVVVEVPSLLSLVIEDATGRAAIGAVEFASGIASAPTDFLAQEVLGLLTTDDVAAAGTERLVDAMLERLIDGGLDRYVRWNASEDGEKKRKIKSH